MTRRFGLIGVLAAGCNSVGTFADLKQTDVWQQSPTDQADILFVVDNSNSMQAEQELLVSGFDSFIESIEEAGADFHLGVITTEFTAGATDVGQLIGSPPFLTRDDDYRTAFAQRAIVGLDGDQKEKGLAAASYAVSPIMTTGANAGFLRAQANLLVVFVTDEDDCSDDGRLGPDAPNTDCYDPARRELLVPVSEYVQRFVEVKSSRTQVQLASIVGPEDAVGICDELTTPGRRYIEATRLTGGIVGSICEPDWSQILFDVGLNAAGVFTRFTMSHGAKEGTLVVTVDGDVVPESPTDGYTYLPDLPGIEFHGIWVPERGAEIAASYTIQPGT